MINIINSLTSRGVAKGGGRSPPPPIIWQSILENAQIWIKGWFGEGGGCEVKRDHTLRKLWIDHLHKAGNCGLEALESSIFLGCYLPPPLAPPPPKSGVWLRPCWQDIKTYTTYSQHGVCKNTVKFIEIHHAMCQIIKKCFCLKF